VLLLTPTTNGAFIAAITNSGNTVASAPYFSCTSAVQGDSASAVFAYSLTEPSTSTRATDIDSGAYPGTYRGSMASTNVAPQACTRDSGGAYQLDGSTSYLTNNLQIAGPTSFSTEVWFKTTTRGGKLIGFGNSQSSLSGQYDRHTYINTAGQLVFGTYTAADGRMTITSPSSVADGAWHHAVATFSSSTGMALWVDGKQVAANSAYRTAEAFTGWWRIGYDNLDTWPGAGGRFFAGSMRFAAVYSTVLTPTQIQNHYIAGR
jgi:hypothetical protein